MPTTSAGPRSCRGGWKRRVVDLECDGDIGDSGLFGTEGVDRRDCACETLPHPRQQTQVSLCALGHKEPFCSGLEFIGREELPVSAAAIQGL